MRYRNLVIATVVALFTSSAWAQAGAGDTLPRLARILDLIKSRYVEPIDENKLFAEAVSGMFRGLDTHSSYLGTEAYQRLLQDTQGKYGGLGIEVRKDGDALRIMTVFEETPAHRAELKPNDLITAINDTSLAGLNLEQSVQLARGEPNTTLTLTLLRTDEPGARKLVLDREQIQGRSVGAGMIGDHLVYVRLANFNRHSAEEMALKLERIFETNGERIEGLVFDLRDNPGGTLNAGVAVASLFLPTDSLIVYTNGMSPESKLKFHARKEDYQRIGAEDALERAPRALKTIPMVVLVNQGTASSSEIVSAALQDYKRALVVGTRTYGKGSIQAVIPLGDGTALKLTTSRYFTPKGRSIDKQGILPDQVIDQDPVDGIDAIAHVVASGRLKVDFAADPVLRAVSCAPGAARRASRSVSAPVIPDSLEEITVADCQLQRALEALHDMHTTKTP